MSSRLRHFGVCHIVSCSNVERDPRFIRRPRRVKRSGPRSCSALIVLRSQFVARVGRNVGHPGHDVLEILA
jgi:hypothetical protein